MGVKRVVDVKFWNDELVETFTPEERYFWLFLLTNPFTTQCGIYHITIKQMSFYLGYEQDVVRKLVDRFENNYQRIKYIDSEIAIKNYLIHSIVKGGYPIEEQIKRELKAVKNNSLIKWVFDNLEGKKENLTQTVSNILNNKYLYINANANANACTHTTVRTCVRKSFTPPTLEQIETYCKERNNNVNAKKFYDYYEASNWKDSKGKPVKNWKQKVITWERDDPKTKKDELPTYSINNNKNMKKEEADELLRLMGKK